MMNYYVNIANLAKSILPFKLRNERQDEWLSALVRPIQDLNTAFSDIVKNHRYDMLFDGQVVYLEHILNDLFDTAQRRIRIIDPTNAPDDDVFITYQIENQPPNYTTFLIENEPGLFVEFASENINFVHFIVKIPALLNTVLITNKMKSIINKYKIAGKKYLIENI